MEAMMLKLNDSSHSHHPGRVKMLAKNSRRGISVLCFNGFTAKRGNVLYHKLAGRYKTTFKLYRL
jgi:hypothetical protein